MLLPVVLFARMALNAIDGMLAREHDMKSRSARCSTKSATWSRMPRFTCRWPWFPACARRWSSAVVLLAVIGEMTGVVGVQIGASRRYDGPMGKSDRAFVFGALALLLGCGVPRGDVADGRAGGVGRPGAA